MVVTRAVQHHHLTVALMVSDEWAVNDARPVDNPQRCILPAVDSTPPRCPEWAKERAIRPQRSLLLAGPLLRTEDRMTLEGRAGTCRSSNAVAGAVSKSVYHPWSPRLTRRGKRLLHYQPYPILKEGGMSCVEDNNLVVLNRAAITAHSSFCCVEIRVQGCGGEPLPLTCPI